MVFGGLLLGVALLGVFCLVETKVKDPMFQLSLFKIRAFAAGNVASLLGAIARGGLQFMLVIWLAGIWLPLHGYDFEVTPLWAGIYMLPLTAGFLIAGPISGTLSDRYGARPFATAGLLVAGVCFTGLMMLPIDFPYWLFALLIFGNGIGSGLFASPNTSAIMSSVPAQHRGAASGMRSTFQNSGMSLSIGIFFSLLVAGLANTLPRALTLGLTAQGVPLAQASTIAHLPPVSTVFAAMLGYNPVHNLLAPTGLLHTLPALNAAVLTGKQFFPHPDRRAVPPRAVDRVHRGGGHGVRRRSGLLVLPRKAGTGKDQSRPRPFWMMSKQRPLSRIRIVPRYEYRCRACGDTFELTPADERVVGAGQLPAGPRRHREAAVHGGRRRPRLVRAGERWRWRGLLRRCLRVRRLRSSLIRNGPSTSPSSSWRRPRAPAPSSRSLP